ncbi:MAG TPA: multicopper oxidase domain-containing protein [Vicinamibacterales bacterium]|nr:multicopper oxidase domain-containing protein [Vicinamibacterales bacterium]
MKSLRGARRHVYAAFLLGLGLFALMWTAPAVAVSPVADVAKDPREVPVSPLGDVSVKLDVVEVIAELETGKPAWVWTFAEPGGKATVPGPMIRVREGNHVTIELCNELDNIEPHNIDFHAAMGPGGGAAVTNVMPGECRTFRFKALRQGAYIYHCAGEGKPWEHVAYGMYGLIQVDPPGGLEPGFKEFYVGQSDWYLKVDEALNTEEGFPPGTYSLDEDRADAEHPNLFTFNGHKNALTAATLYGEAITVNQGDRVRFFFVTGGPNIGSNWHIIGTIFDTVYTGSRSTAVENEETVYVAPGSAAVFELSTPVPGQYLLVDHALFRVPKGAAGFMHVTKKKWPLDIYSPEAIGTGH